MNSIITQNIPCACVDMGYTGEFETAWQYEQRIARAERIKLNAQTQFSALIKRASKNGNK